MLKIKEIKIAIVEDDLYFRRSLERYVRNICEPFESKGLIFNVTVFKNANEAILELDNELDFMVLDYYLHDPDCDDYLNGKDVINAVKEHCSKCKIILVSASSNQLKNQAEIKGNIHGFVDKNTNTVNRLGAIIQESLQTELRA